MPRMSFEPVAPRLQYSKKTAAAARTQQPQACQGCGGSWWREDGGRPRGTAQRPRGPRTDVVKMLVQQVEGLALPEEEACSTSGCSGPLVSRGLRREWPCAGAGGRTGEVVELDPLPQLQEGLVPLLRLACGASEECGAGAHTLWPWLCASPRAGAHLRAAGCRAAHRSRSQRRTRPRPASRRRPRPCADRVATTTVPKLCGQKKTLCVGQSVLQYVVINRTHNIT